MLFDIRTSRSDVDACDRAEFLRGSVTHFIIRCVVTGSPYRQFHFHSGILHGSKTASIVINPTVRALSLTVLCIYYIWNIILFSAMFLFLLSWLFLSAVVYFYKSIALCLKYLFMAFILNLVYLRDIYISYFSFDNRIISFALNYIATKLRR